MRVPERIKAVLFDLDGTLVDSMYMWKQIDIEFLGQFGIPLPDDLQKSIEGMSFSETAQYFKDRFWLPLSIPEIKKTWNEMAFWKYTHEVELKPGARNFLNHLAERKIKMGIATSNSRELVTAVTETLEIDSYFSQITVGCQVAKGKPAPDVYLYTAQKLQVLPQHCLVLEDVPAGILAGKNAGMTVWAVEDEYSIPFREEKQKLADGFLTTYDEIEF